MTKFKSWVQAARLRTLPLSISGVFVGGALAHYHGTFNLLLFALIVCTAIGFQITSNFANDYGDGIKGTDNEDRIGPKRAMQSGLLSAKELKTGIVISSVLCLTLVLIVVFLAFGIKNLLYPLLFIGLGVASVWAAIKYTVGDSAYGYRGLGDIFVFLFFGLLSVLGTSFLFLKSIVLMDFLPAISIGLLSVGVLNLNNLRDYESDKKVEKNTLVVKMGFANGKKYHYILLTLAFLSMLMFTWHNYKIPMDWVHMIGFIPITFHFIRVKRNRAPVLLDSELKKLALSTFFVAVSFYLCFNKFS